MCRDGHRPGFGSTRDFLPAVNAAAWRRSPALAGLDQQSSLAIGIQLTYSHLWNGWQRLLLKNKTLHWTYCCPSSYLTQHHEAIGDSKGIWLQKSRLLQDTSRIDRKTQPLKTTVFTRSSTGEKVVIQFSWREKTTELFTVETEHPNLL